MEILLSAAAEVGSRDVAPHQEDASPPPIADSAAHSDTWITPFLASLVDHDLLGAVSPDVPALLRLLPTADRYVQDEVEIRHHPTLTRRWSRKGRHGQRRVRAPGQSLKVLAFGAVDWRDGWNSVGFGRNRSATLFCKQLDHLVERSQQRGRIAIVLGDNANIHTPWGSKLVRETVKRHGDRLRLVYTPAYDPEANPTERLWPPFRRAVTHNHHRDDMVDLYHDALAYFDELDNDPQRVLRHIGSPYAHNRSGEHSPASVTHD